MNLKKFRQQQFEQRTDYVDVPELTAWLFDDGETPRVKVRGLSANELFVAQEQVAKNSPLRTLAEAAANGNKGELKAAFERILGTDGKTTTAMLASRIEMCIKGVIDEQGKPIFDHQDAARIAQHFPLVFVRMTNRIDTLTGQGGTALGESSRHSGAGPTSSLPAPSPSDSGNASTSAVPTSSPTTT